MNNIHEKSKRSEIPRYAAAELEFLEATEDHRRNEESPEDHSSNDEGADQHSMSPLIIAADNDRPVIGSRFDHDIDGCGFSLSSTRLGCSRVAQCCHNTLHEQRCAK